VAAATVATARAVLLAVPWVDRAAQIADVQDHGTAPLVTPPDGWPALDLVRSVYESAGQKAPMTLPLGTRKGAQFANARWVQLCTKR
jgi:hypothetical protein